MNKFTCSECGIEEVEEEGDCCDNCFYDEDEEEEE